MAPQGDAKYCIGMISEPSSAMTLAKGTLVESIDVELVVAAEFVATHRGISSSFTS